MDINNMIGRKNIYTSQDTINDENILSVLGEAFKIHSENAKQIEYLVDYYKGVHDEILNRKKEVRNDVDSKLIFNYPISVTRDIGGYVLGKPIRFIQRKATNRDEVKLINDMLSYIGKAKIDKDVLEDAIINGVSYYGVFPKKDEDAPLMITRLDPAKTFVVKSLDLGNKPMMCVSYYTYTKTDKNGAEVQTNVYTVYTEQKEYVIENPFGWVDFTDAEIKSKKGNSLGGLLPIIEMPMNKWNMGLWEPCITLFNGIDLLGSDSLNDIVQFVNSLLVIAGVEVTSEEFAKIEQDKLINLIVPPNSGITPEVKYVAQQLNSTSVSDLREYLETSYRIIIGVPDRKTKSSGGGDTGEAVSMRDGWLDIDLVASNCEDYIIQANRQLLNVVLYILKINKKINKLKSMEIDIKFNRNKTVNLQTKTTAFSSLIGTNKLDPVDALEIVDLTTDVQDVISRGEAYNKKQQQEMLKNQVVENQPSNNGVDDTNKVSTQK